MSSVYPIAYTEVPPSGSAQHASAATFSPKNFVVFDQNQPGLTENVTRLTETPSENYRNMLLPEESIIGEFDCYFPSGMIPKWKIMLLLVMTGGLYGFVLLYRMFLRWCYRNRCLTPTSLEFQRGRLAVTSFGRILCWEQKVSQVKQERGCCFDCMCCFCKLCCRNLCAANVQYSMTSTARVYHCADIREVAQYFSSTPGFLCCCLEYECGLQVTMRSFDHAPHRQSGGMKTMDNHSYYNMMRSMLNNVIAAAESVVGVAAEGTVLYIMSGTMDIVYNGDTYAVLDSLADLHAQFIACLPSSPDIVIPHPNLVGDPLHAPSDPNAIGGTHIVYDDHSVTIPAKWLSMLPGEQVIAASGEVYHMRWWEWALTCLTCGRYYCDVIRKKKFSRTAFVLTNKRLVQVEIFHRAGMVPEYMTNFSVQLRTLLPGAIYSGQLSSTGLRNLEVLLETDGGTVHMNMFSGMRAFPFAKALMMSAHRVNNRVMKPNGGNVLFDANAVSFFPADDHELMPLLPGETLNEVLTAKIGWQPFSLRHVPCCRFCLGPELTMVVDAGCILQCMACNDWKMITNACSHDAMGCCFPCVPHYLLCCALRPFQSKSTLFVTDSAIISFERSGNYGLCGFLVGDGKPCCNEGCCKTTAFSVSWSSISRLSGHNIQMSAEGTETITRRLCQHSPCAFLCPLVSSRFQVEVDCDKFNHTLHEEEVNVNYKEDSRLLTWRKALDVLALSLYNSRAAVKSTGDLKKGIEMV